MKVLLFGCNGLLGQNVLASAPEESLLIASGIEDTQIIQGDSIYHQADLTRQSQVSGLIEKIRPEFIINCAAMTNVDLCEKEKEMCRIVNRDAVGWMAGSGIPMLHLSTDYVFDGTSGPYREEDKTNPLGYYGQTKLESESLVLSGSSDSIVVRTMLLWGRGHGLKTSFVEFVKTSLEQKKQIRIVTDQRGDPTLAHELATVIWKLIEKNRKGVYHVSGSENINRFDWAKEIADFYNLDAVHIHPILTTDLQQPAPRPLKSGFILDKMAKDTGVKMSGIQGQLQSIP